MLVGASWSPTAKLAWTLGIFGAFFAAALYGLRKLTAAEENAGKKTKKEKRSGKKSQ
eukprot:GDKH01006517.1.p1 GENE.GDKH01006517.1~~GDKH01006517.1.p1  ORF type:complete len:57 (-),score=19.00 GDKH01006517.1:146-316(-)